MAATAGEEHVSHCHSSPGVGKNQHNTKWQVTQELSEGENCLKAFRVGLWQKITK